MLHVIVHGSVRAMHIASLIFGVRLLVRAAMAAAAAAEEAASS
jgi:hypothetical protein